MPLVQDTLPTLDEARGLLDEFGLRPYQVFLRIRDWSGNRVNEGSFTDTDTELTVGRGRRPALRLVQGKDIAVSAGEFSSATYEVGPFTPEHEGGGTDPATLDPPKVAGREVLFVVKGPGLPEVGVLCRRIDDDLTSPFRWMLKLERIGRNAG